MHAMHNYDMPNCKCINIKGDSTLFTVFPSMFWASAFVSAILAKLKVHKGIELINWLHDHPCISPAVTSSTEFMCALFGVEELG